MSQPVNLALTRKHRPNRFEGSGGLRDQEHITKSLKRAVATGRVAHAYLFSGPRGTGKTTLARIMAAALNCRNPNDDHEPCTVCDECVRIHHGQETMDVVEIDAASNNGVDDARRLRERTSYAPSREGAHKVYIIDEAHMLTTQAWNALLKVIEEPPPRVVFFACTTEPEKIVQRSSAVLSRFQRHTFRRISEQEIIAGLRDVAEREKINVSPDALALIAHLAQGGMRDAVGMLDEIRGVHPDPGQIVTGEDLRRLKGIPSETLHLGAIDILLGGTEDSNRGRVFDLSDHLLQAGNQFGVFITEFERTLLDLQAIRAGKPLKESAWSEKAIRRLKVSAGRMPSEAIAATLRLIMEHRADLRGGSASIAFFTFMQRAIQEVGTLSQEVSRDTP